nr:unnamed protein product [Haemonchus contortus]
MKHWLLTRCCHMGKWVVVRNVSIVVAYHLDRNSPSLPIEASRVQMWAPQKEGVHELVVTVLSLHRRDVTYPIDSRSNRGSRVGSPFTSASHHHDSIRPLVKVTDLSVRGRESPALGKKRSDQGSRVDLIVHDAKPFTIFSAPTR